MLSRKHNTKAAKRFFKKVLSNKHVKNPYVVNVDKNPAFVPAHAELQKFGDFKQTTKLRQVKYLNNGIENDHKSTKFKSRYRQWYKSFDTAKNTIDAVETMRMIQKGQLRYAGKDVCAQKNGLQFDCNSRQYGSCFCFNFKRASLVSLRESFNCLPI